MKGSTISFLLTESEFKLLESVVYLEPFLGDFVTRAKLKDGKYRIKLPSDDLRDTLSALSFARDNICSYREKAKFGCLCDKIKAYILLRQELRQSTKL